MKIQPVYIVDDSADYRFLLNFFLGRHLKDLPVFFFEDAQSLFLRLAELSEDETQPILPAVIILDLNMPGINGYKALELIKHPESLKTMWWKEIPVIIHTSNLSVEISEICHAKGASAVFEKAVELEDLIILKDYLFQLTQLSANTQLLPR